MTEIVILSGKGGTGKTSLSASFATIEENIVVADCDVDAANLYLILQPDNNEEHVFISGHKAEIDYSKCFGCSICYEHCRFDAIEMKDGSPFIIETSCDGCMLCSKICPVEAIKMIPNDKSRWYEGEYRNGYMVHARLSPGEENSGKLVSVVRENAKKTAINKNSPLIIIDGPPGTGCPVISSLTGTNKAVIVTEPTKSGFHDLKRIIELTANFGVKTYIVINKYDLNLDISGKIEEWCHSSSLPVIGQIPFDKQFIDAMINCKSIIEWAPSSQIAQEIKKIWKTIVEENNIYSDN
jgi:MinD superfamily P-loop ATPase